MNKQLVKKRTKTWLVLLGIFLLAFLLRICKVYDYPPLSWDEAALGYNAFSILETGRDEHGKLLPLIFKSFGDYKPGFYVYLAIPFVKLLGLSQLATRLPGVILGSLTPMVLYLLVSEITKKRKIAILSAAFLAFLPWHIHFSRGAWESSVMVFFVTLGSWLFIKGCKSSISKKNSHLAFSLIPFLLALWTYQGAKLFIPIVLAGLFVLYFKNLKSWYFKNRRNGKELTLILLTAVLACCWYLQSFSGPESNRLKAMSIFSYREPITSIDTVLKEDGLAEKDLHYYLFHGEWIHFTRSIMLRYFNHFSPRFLAFDGDWSNPRYSAPHFGMIGLPVLVLVLIGLASCYSKGLIKGDKFMIYWLLASPLPSALTRDIVSGVRALPMVIPLCYFAARGLVYIINMQLFKNALIKLIGCTFIFSVFTITFGYYLDLYYNHLVFESRKDWLYGYREAVSFVRENREGVDNILFSDFYGQPYIYYLFYSQYSPEKYQRENNQADVGSIDMGRVGEVDNIIFKGLSWHDGKSLKNTLFVFSDEDIIRSEIIMGEAIRPLLIPLGNNDRGGSTFYGYKSK